MTEFFKIENEDGVFKTILPPFDNKDWPEIVSTHGYIWIRNPFLDLSGQLDSLVANTIFKTTDLDLKCSIHRMELDVSVPTIDFLRFVEVNFSHGIDFILSKKHQPTGFDLSSIPKSKWPIVMAQNKIILTFHRPAGGEPSVLTSSTPEVLKSICERLSQN
tara:strand:+ start:2510 stop:2992 length:483 start_codon:yes stop_codon:yes gene_type:complete